LTRYGVVYRSDPVASPFPVRREVCVLSLDHGTTLRPVQTALPREAARAGQGKARLMGTLFVAAATLLLALAAGDALAGTLAGGNGDDALRGSGQDERLAGFGGEDKLWGLDGEDVLFGGVDDDELYGGGGRDTLVGGAGDDFVETKDGARDYVECGPGNDVASVDFGDLVSRSCETIYPG
jgi:RTX calcium-binding nonapeptide repeat (4 copies)